MNRDHLVAEAERYIFSCIHSQIDFHSFVLVSCLSEAHRLFPGHVNIDVIFGRPRQTVSSWMKELRQVYT